MMPKINCLISMRTLIIVVAPFLLSSCGYTIVKSPIQVELQRSSPQTIVFENTGENTIALVPTFSTAEAILIDPGASTTIEVAIASIRSTRRADDVPWLQADASPPWNVIVGPSPEGFLGQADLDAVVNVRVGDQPPEERRISLSSCGGGDWVDRPADPASHVIDLANPPLPGVPVRLCP
jgi:hypothetical protein